MRKTAGQLRLEDFQRLAILGVLFRQSYNARIESCQNAPLADSQTEEVSVGRRLFLTRHNDQLQLRITDVPRGEYGKTARLLHFLPQIPTLAERKVLVPQLH